MAKFDAHLKCSFCGKSQDQVRKLIAGPGVYICDECIDLCNEILDEELVDSQGNPRQSNEASRKPAPGVRKSNKPAPTLASIPKPQEIKSFLTSRWWARTPPRKSCQWLSITTTSDWPGRAMARVKPNRPPRGCTRATSC